MAMRQMAAAPSTDTAITTDSGNNGFKFLDVKLFHKNVNTFYLVKKKHVINACIFICG